MIFPEPIELVPQPGYIYLVRLDNIYKTEYKIGKTRDLKKRLETLYSQTACRIHLIAYGVSQNTHFAERRIQSEYFEQCVHGEYFNFNCGQLWHVINTLNAFCYPVVTDYNKPICQHDGTPLVGRWNKQNFRCPTCGHIIYYDRYLTDYTRMLPSACDELNDDDNRFINDKYDAVYNWREK